MGLLKSLARVALESIAERDSPEDPEPAVVDPARAPCPRCGAPASRRIVASFGKRRPITCGQCGEPLGVETS